MKDDLQLLNEYIEEQVPEDFGNGGDNDGADDDVQVMELQDPNLLPRQMNVPVQPDLLRPPDAGNILVGFIPIGPNVQFSYIPGDTQPERPGVRGKDVCQRGIRRCAQCWYVVPRPSTEQLRQCPGRNKQENCPNWSGQRKQIPRGQ